MPTDVLVSLLHPTRERMDLCLATTRRWSESVEECGFEVEHLVAIDRDDATAYAEYLRLGGGKETWFDGHQRAFIMDGARLELGEAGAIANMPADDADISGFLTAVNKVNRLASRANGQWLFFIADDFQPIADDWLQAMKTTMDRWDPTKDRIVLSPEPAGRALVNHPIISRAFYEHQGWFFCPEYLHICVDSDLHLVATLEKALHHLPLEVCGKFKHHNPYLTADAQWDKVYGIGNNAALYAQGRRVFAKRQEMLLANAAKVDAATATTDKTVNEATPAIAPRACGLNIGCGSRPKASEPSIAWTNMDQAAGPGVDVVRDIRRGFPFSDNTFDTILMDNVLEHFVSDDVIFLLNEIHRVAKPGARVTIIVPHAQSQGAVQDPTHKSLFVPRSALYWNQHDTRFGGIRVGISANLRSKAVTVTGDMGTEAFITFELVAEK